MNHFDNIFDRIHFLLPDFFLPFIFGAFVYFICVFFFFRKSQKGKNIILAISDNIGLQKDKVTLFLNLLLISEMSIKPRITIFFI